MTHTIQKIIALLESEDEKNIPIGLKLMESLRLEKEVFEALLGENVLPQSIIHEATSKVSFYFDNQQITIQSRKAYLEFYDKLNNFMRTFSADITTSQRMFNLINTAFFVFAGRLNPQESSLLQVLTHPIRYYIFFGLKTSWITAMEYHKQAKALLPESGKDVQIRWRDLTAFCDLPIYYQITPTSEELVQFDLLLKVKQ